MFTYFIPRIGQKILKRFKNVDVDVDLKMSDCLLLFRTKPSPVTLLRFITTYGLLIRFIIFALTTRRSMKYPQNAAIERFCVMTVISLHSFHCILASLTILFALLAFFEINNLTPLLWSMP